MLKPTTTTSTNKHNDRDSRIVAVGQDDRPSVRRRIDRCHHSMVFTGKWRPLRESAARSRERKPETAS